MSPGEKSLRVEWRRGLSRCPVLALRTARPGLLTAHRAKRLALITSGAAVLEPLDAACPSGRQELGMPRKRLNLSMSLLDLWQRSGSP